MTAEECGKLIALQWNACLPSGNFDPYGPEMADLAHLLGNAIRNFADGMKERCKLAAEQVADDFYSEKSREAAWKVVEAIKELKS